MVGFDTEYGVYAPTIQSILLIHKLNYSVNLLYNHTMQFNTTLVRSSKAKAARFYAHETAQQIETTIKRPKFPRPMCGWYHKIPNMQMAS
jgi:hypothetical protein